MTRYFLREAGANWPNIVMYRPVQPKPANIWPVCTPAADDKIFYIYLFSHMPPISVKQTAEPCDGMAASLSVIGSRYPAITDQLAASTIKCFSSSQLFIVKGFRAQHM